MTTGPVVPGDACLQAPVIWLQVAKHLEAHLSCVEHQSLCISSSDAAIVTLPFISAPLTSDARRLCHPPPSDAESGVTPCAVSRQAAIRSHVYALLWHSFKETVARL